MITAKQQERRDRAEERAAKLRRKSEAAYTAARAELDGIPEGQPILAGHHSEAKHRGALKRHDAKARKAVALLDAAKSASHRAAGAGRAVMSDDPEALHALRAQLAKAEERRDLEKKINRLWRRGGVAALRAGGISDALVKTAEETMSRAPWLSAPCVTTNGSANIRRLKKRIAELEALAIYQPAEDIVGDGFRIEEDVEEVRVRVHFDRRPDRETCRIMRRAGFRFSRTHQAWQRQLTANGVAAAKRVARELFGWIEGSAS